MIVCVCMCVCARTEVSTDFCPFVYSCIGARERTTVTQTQHQSGRDELCRRFPKIRGRCTCSMWADRLIGNV